MGPDPQQARPTEVTEEEAEKVKEAEEEETKTRHPPEGPDTHPHLPRPVATATTDTERTLGTVWRLSHVHG